MAFNGPNNPVLERRFDLKGSAIAPEELHLNATCKTQLPSSPKFTNSHFVTLARPYTAEELVASLCHSRKQKKGGKIFPRPILVTQPLPHKLVASGIHPCIREIEEQEEEEGGLPDKALRTDTVMFLFPFPKHDISHAPRYHLILPLASKDNLDEQVAHKLSIFRHYVLSFQNGLRWSVLIDQCVSVKGAFSLKSTRALVQRASALMEVNIGITLLLHHSSQTQMSLQLQNMKSIPYLTCLSHPDDRPITMCCTTCLAQVSPSECAPQFNCPNASCDSHQRGGWNLGSFEGSAPQAPQALRRPNSTQSLPQRTRLQSPNPDFSPNFRSNVSPPAPKPQFKPLEGGSTLQVSAPIQEGVMQHLGNVYTGRGQASQDRHDPRESALDSLVYDLTARLDNIASRTKTLEARGNFPPLESGDAPKWTLSQKTWESWTKKVSKLPAEMQKNVDQLAEVCRQRQLATEKSLARIDDLARPSPSVINVGSPSSTPPHSPPAGPSTPADALSSPTSSPLLQTQPGTPQQEAVNE